MADPDLQIQMGGGGGGGHPDPEIRERGASGSATNESKLGCMHLISKVNATLF